MWLGPAPRAVARASLDSRVASGRSPVPLRQSTPMSTAISRAIACFASPTRPLPARPVAVPPSDGPERRSRALRAPRQRESRSSGPSAASGLACRIILVALENAGCEVRTARSHTRAARRTAQAVGHDVISESRCHLINEERRAPRSGALGCGPLRGGTRGARRAEYDASGALRCNRTPDQGIGTPERVGKNVRRDDPRRSASLRRSATTRMSTSWRLSTSPGNSGCSRSSVGNGHLIRLTEEGALETRFLGELTDEREAAAT